MARWELIGQRRGKILKRKRAREIERDEQTERMRGVMTKRKKTEEN